MNNIPTMYNVSYETRNSLLEIPNIGKLKQAGIAIFGGNYHTEYIDNENKVIARVDDMYDTEMKDFIFQGSGVFGKTGKYHRWKDAVFATIEAITGINNN